jgi:hypothetical protein
VTDPAAQAARSAAAILAPDLGPALPAEVEAALAARHTVQRPDRYPDPVSLASLIVSIATLAWTIYNDQRTRHDQPDHDPGPQSDVIARQVRITLRDQDIQLPPGTERITEIIATEITRHASPPTSPANHRLPSPRTENRDSGQGFGIVNDPRCRMRAEAGRPQVASGIFTQARELHNVPGRPDS